MARMIDVFADGQNILVNVDTIMWLLPEPGIKGTTIYFIDGSRKVVEVEFRDLRKLILTPPGTI